jgi:hypothetical protein
VRYDHKTQPAHRVSYRISLGPIAEGHYVRQRCENRLCVRPGHLVLTQAIGPYGLKFKVPNGEEVAGIRRAYKQTDLTITEIAAKFGVTPYRVTRIGRGTYRIGRETS